MTQAVANLFSWSFLVSVLIGFFLDRVAAYLKVCWLERNRPLPGGGHRSRWRAALGIDTRMVAAGLGLVVVAWSIFQTQANTNEAARLNNDATAFAARVQRCQAALITAIVDSRAVTTENDRLSVEERALLADGQRLTFDLIRDVFNTPPDIQVLAPGDPRRQAFILQRADVYLGRIGALEEQVDRVHAEQDTNVRSRPPLPAPSCGAQ